MAGGAKLIHEREREQRDARGSMAYLSVMSWNGDLRESVLWSLSSSVVGEEGAEKQQRGPMSYCLVAIFFFNCDRQKVHAQISFYRLL